MNGKMREKIQINCNIGLSRGVSYMSEAISVTKLSNIHHKSCVNLSYRFLH